MTPALRIKAATGGILSVAIMVAGTAGSVAAADMPTCTIPQLQNAFSQPLQGLTSHAADAAPPPLQIERPWQITLSPCDANWCERGSYAARVPVRVPRAGRWRVAVDAPVWIDLRRDETLLTGLLCEHAGCAPIRKIVQYEVQAGTYWVIFQGRQPAEVRGLVSEVR